MRHLITVCISLIVVSLIFVDVSNAKVDPASAIGAWLFDEGSGNKVKDSSKNGNDGKLTGTKWVDGKFGKALDFNGSSDYVEIPDSDSLDVTNSIAIVAWIFKKADASHGGTIVGKWKQMGDTWSYVLYGLGDSGGGFRLMWTDKPTNQTNLEGPYQLPNNEWIHYAATYDGSIMRVFSNAKELVNIAANKKINISTNPVWIGNDGYQQHFNGIIDEFAIFNTALSENDINSIMTQGLALALAVGPSASRLVNTWGKIKLAEGK